jgi:hypothetical protein
MQDTPRLRIIIAVSVCEELLHGRSNDATKCSSTDKSNVNVPYAVHDTLTLTMLKFIWTPALPAQGMAGIPPR